MWRNCFNDLRETRETSRHRRYRVADLPILMHENMQNPALGTRCILYAGVSTKKSLEAENWDRQLGRRTGFAAQQPRAVAAALPDVASGLNAKRRGLHPRLDLARNHPARAGRARIA